MLADSLGIPHFTSLVTVKGVGKDLQIVSSKKTIQKSDCKHLNIQGCGFGIESCLWVEVF